MLIQSIKNNLSENIELLRQLTNDEFTQKNPELSNATIGEHMRLMIRTIINGLSISRLQRLEM